MSGSGRNSPLPIVYEDRYVLVADKPAGLLTVPTGTESARSLSVLLGEWARRTRPPERILVVHRLDREASGLVVFAKSPAAKEALQEQFKDHSAGRTYLAIVEGRVSASTFTIRSYLAENTAFRVYSAREPTARNRARLAVTHVKVVARQAKSTLLEVRLETGRKHQIRVHLADAGHPIVGDKLYGSGWDPFKRLALHGAVLEFNHPQDGRRARFESPMPKGLPAPPESK